MIWYLNLKTVIGINFNYYLLASFKQLIIILETGEKITDAKFIYKRSVETYRNFLTCILETQSNELLLVFDDLNSIYFLNECTGFIDKTST